MSKPAWSQQPLVELCERPDDIRCGPFGTQLNKDEFRTSGVPLWGIKHVNAEFELDTDEFVEPATAERLANYDLRAGDLVMTRKGTIGNCAVYPETFSPGIMHSDLLRLRLDPCQADPSFFAYQLHHSSDVHRQLSLISGGAVMPGINVGKLKKLKVGVPPLAEQKRIAGILDAADALRAKRRESLAQLDTLLQATFLDMFGDPVTNPMGFPIKTLSELYINKRDGTKCGPFGSALRKSELVEAGVPVWNMDNIDPSGRMALPFRMWITEAKYRQLAAYAVLDGDVVISRAGTVGKMCVANSGCGASIISTNLIRVRFGPNLLPIYFVSLMNYCKGRVGRLRTGPDGAFTHMSTGVLDKLKFPCPPLDDQQRFATVVESVEKQKASQRAHLEELDTLFASLQSRAFRGDL